MEHELFRAFLSYLAARQEFVPVAQRFYSQVYRITGRRIYKVISSHQVMSEGFRTKSEASAFGTDILAYMEKLAALGVPIPPIEETHLFILNAQATRRPFIVLDTIDGGSSIEMLWEQEESSNGIMEFTAGMIQAILPVLLQEKPAGGYGEVGIDAMASNFTLLDGCITYIDFTPPRYYSPDRGYRIEYPQPADEGEVREGIWRYYEAEGIIIRLFTDCCRILPDKRNVFLETIRDELPNDLWRRVTDVLSSIHLPADLHAPEWKAAIQSAKKPIELRDLACAIAAADGLMVSAKKWLEEFFHASRHHPGQPVAEERLNSLRTLLFERRISLLEA